VTAIIRSLIIWLALLAVPFQGFASAAMLPCAPSPAAAAHAHMHMAGMAHAQHDHAAVHHTDSARLSHHDAKCGNCASCCIGAALMPLALVAAAPHGAAALAIPSDAGHLPSVDLDHPERPPRFERA
jgi:hypothetical protein